VRLKFKTLLIAALIGQVATAGCTRYEAVDAYVRARPGVRIRAIAKSDPGSKATYRVAVISDEGKLATMPVEATGDEPYILELDKWSGEFLKLRFEARGARAGWKAIHIDEPWVDEVAAGDITPDNPPNVVIYLVDALRADRLGCYNGQVRTSPGIDAFARDAALYKRAYSPSSWTRPSVASVFTGADAPAHGAVGRTGSLDENMPTLAELMKEAGYHTAAFVTNGNVAGEFGFARGFDVYHYLPENPGGIGVYASSDELLDKIQPELEKLDQPFFLYIHQSDPHAPYTPPRDLARRFTPPEAEPIPGTMDVFKKLVHRAMVPSPGQVKHLLGLYDAEVAAADAGFGRFMDFLRDRGVAEKTLIVFTADHGEEFYLHRGFGHGGTLYEELIRVPLIVRYPGTRGAQVAGEPVSIADIPATILGYLGIKTPPTMRGVDLRAIGAKDPSPCIRALYFHELLDKVDKEAIIDWPMKLIRNTNKINQWGDRVLEWELYDLAADSYEQHPLGRSRKITRRVLEEELRSLSRFNASTTPPSRRKPSSELKKRLESIGY